MKIFYFTVLIICLIATNGYTASNKEDYELQGKCAKDAEKRFSDIDHYFSIYRNHFNRKMNRCFMVVTMDSQTSPNYIKNKPYTRTETLYDVNEEDSIIELYKFYSDATHVLIRCFGVYVGVGKFCDLNNIFFDLRTEPGVNRYHLYMNRWEAFIKPYMEE
jgi:hypothetical protein